MKSRAIQKPELTEEEKRQPYAKYLNRQPATPAKEALEYLRSRQEIPVEDALLAENGNMNDILKDGYMKCEYGVCTLPNGGGYVAMLNKMPGVTFQMYQFWNNWWSKEDQTLRYRIWNPRDHYKAGFRWSSEDVGKGVEDLIFLDHLVPENLGIDGKLAKESSLLLADGGNVISKAIDAEPLSAPQPGVVGHFVRDMADGSGIELRSRFWKGYQFGPDGLFCAMGPDTPRETLDTLLGLAEHNACEMANLASILPSLYAEQNIQ